LFIMGNYCIVNTLKYERFVECLKKGVYGLSEGVLRTRGGFLKNLNGNDIIFIKLSTVPQLIAGPFVVTEPPKSIRIKKSWGKCFKIDTETISNSIPWWVAEGYDCLIFFDRIPDSKLAEISSDLSIPDLGSLQDQAMKSLMEHLLRKGKPIND